MTAASAVVMRQCRKNLIWNKRYTVMYKVGKCQCDMIRMAMVIFYRRNRSHSLFQPPSLPPPLHDEVEKKSGKSGGWRGGTKKGKREQITHSIKFVNVCDSGPT